jgi:EpsI family protein
MLRPDAFLHRVYTREDGYPVDVTVVFGHAKDTFHSPGTCLTGDGWVIAQKDRCRLLPQPRAKPVWANQFVLERKGKHAVALYWYASYGATDASWVEFQYHMLRNRLSGRPSSGALIRFMTPAPASDELAAEVVGSLAAQLAPDLHRAMGL